MPSRERRWVIRTGVIVAAVLFLFQGTAAARKITAKESESQSKAKGRYYNPTPLQVPQFEHPDFSLEEFDQMVANQNSNRRTPSPANTQSPEVSPGALTGNLQKPTTSAGAAPSAGTFSDDEQKLQQQMMDHFQQTLKYAAMLQEKNRQRQLQAETELQRLEEPA